MRRARYMWLSVIVIIALGAIIGFLCVAGLVWLVCWAFGLSWSWKLAIGIWAVMMLVAAAVKSVNTGSKK